MCLAGGAQAFTHHPSTPAERAQTRALNEEQLKLAQQENAGLAMNANSTATDASADMAANAPPAAAPTAPVQQANADAVRPPGSGPTSGR
jgi:hypothetical protein